MTTAELVFLYAAEELNIGRAADRAYVSQQCASTHIKNLETRYGITLFNRKPGLSLTPAGRCLQTSLLQIRQIEQNAEAGIEEISKGNVGKLTVALNPTRCRILIPPILERFSKEFPRVEVSIHLGDTLNNLELLRQGKTDIVIGIGTSAVDAARFSVNHLMKDPVYFLVSRDMIGRYCPDFKERTDDKGMVSLRELKAFPFCRNYEGSTLTNLIDTYLYQEKIALNTRYYISDYDTQLEMCMNGIAAMFCPAMMLDRIPEGHDLLVYPVKEIREGLSIDLIRNSYAYTPRYVKAFISLLKETIEQVQKDVSGYDMDK